MSEENKKKREGGYCHIPLGDTARRRKEVAKLFMKGLTTVEAANKLGEMGFVNPTTGKPFSRQTIGNDYQVVLKETMKHIVEDTEDFFSEIIMYLTDIIQRNIDKDDKTTLAALEHLAKLSNVKPPENINITQNEGTDVATWLKWARKKKENT